MATVTDLTTPQYPIRAGIVAARLSVFDPCTRKAKLGAKKGIVTQAVTDVKFSPDISDDKKITIKSANPLRANNGKWYFPPQVQGGKLDLTFTPGLHDLNSMYTSGATILNGATIVGWVDYVGPVAEMLAVEVWRLLNYGPSCTPASDLVEREVYIAGWPMEGDRAFTDGGDGESTQLSLELQPLIPAAPIVLTGTATVSGNVNITVTSTTDISVGDLVTGTGITTGTRVATVTDATHLALTVAATATGTVTVTVSYGGPFGDFPAGVMTQLDAAYTASKSVFRLRFSEADLPSSLTGTGFITIT